MEKILWIIFDVGGVVISPTLRNQNGYSIGTRFFNSEELEGIYSSKDYTNYMLGYISHEQFIGKYLKQHKLDLSVAEFDELFKKDIMPIEGMDILFQKLAQNYKIALATNEGKVIAKYKIEGSRLIPYLSKVIPSYLLKEIKPSVNFFKKTLGIINAQPAECVFIDDVKINCDAAASVGIKSIQYKSLEQLKKELMRLHLQ